jgi:hypothetical protein
VEVAGEEDFVIRVTRSRVAHGNEEAFLRDIRGKAIPMLADEPGIVYGAFGRRLEDDASVFVGVSVWTDMGALMRLTGAHTHAPLELDGGNELIEDASVELYELIGEWGRAAAET